MEQYFPKNNWTKFLIENGVPQELKDINQKILINTIINDTCDFLDKSHIGRAIDRISLGLLIDKTLFLSKFKKKGFLRHSRYFDGKTPVTGISNHIISNKDLFLLEEAEILYFESLINLESLFFETKKIYTNLCKLIRNYKPKQKKNSKDIIGNKSIIKSLLSFNEFSFLSRKPNEYGSLKSMDDQSLTIEQQSESISYLISLISETSSKHTFEIFIDDDFLKSKKHEHWIQDAFFIKEFRELEIEIESLGYICLDSHGNFKITHNDINLLKSIELSHIIGEGQKDANLLRTSKKFKNLSRISELASAIHEKFPNTIHFSALPYPRYRMELVAPIIHAILAEQLGSFYEEYEGLMYIQDELGISKTDIGKFQLVDELFLSEFLIIHRVFFVLQFIYSEHLFVKINDSNYYNILNSLIVIFDEKTFDNIFEPVIAKVKVVKYLELMSWEYEGKDYLDLQYTPILKTNEYFVFSLSVLRYSRSIRNLIASLSKRGMNLKGNQMALMHQIGEHLSECFKNKDFKCWTGVNINFKSPKQNKSDIDFLAYKDDTLFVCEYKDVFDSVDSFEYRRINDYTIKAASQLTYIKLAISDPQYQVSLGKRLDLDLSTVSKFCYLIIISSKKLFGCNVSDFPVRNVREIYNFLEDATWQFKLPDQDLRTFNLWKATNFQIDDLLEYCSDEGPHSNLLNAMFPIDRKISRKYNQEKYVLDFPLAISNMAKMYGESETKE